MLGERIGRARKAMGISLRVLAGKANISHSAIHKYERNKDIPSSEVLIRLADALRVSFDYFFRESKVKLSDANFRKRYKLGKKKQNKILSEAEDFLEKYFTLENLYPIRPSEFKNPGATQKKVSNLNELETIAVTLRNEWDLGLDPIKFLVETLESKGVKIVLHDIQEEDFDGCSAWLNGLIPVVVVSKHWPGDRQRFTIGHELGHLLVHNIDNTVNKEKAANRFSAAFLIPKDAVYNELGRKRHLFYREEMVGLKHKYGVSIACWLKRARDLNIISESYYKELMINFRKKGWHKKEPGREIKPEKPRRLERLIFKALAERMISESKAAELMSTSISEMRELIKPIGGRNRLNEIRC